MSAKVKSKEVAVTGVNRRNDRRAGAVGVVLFQLGGPDSLEAIEPFLYNLFSDPDIIDFPFARLARPTLARLVSSHRAKKVREHYASIGGKSPIRELTERQAAALEQELRKSLDAWVFVAMRYWHPLTEEVARQVSTYTLQELVLLPLYPQYSKTTTGSSLNEWNRKYPPQGTKPLPAKVIREYYSYPLYIESVVENVTAALERFGRGPESTRDVPLVFSAHGVPVSIIEAGDPYQAQVEGSVELVMKRGGWSNPHRLCYQSRSGPGRWLEPSLEDTLRDLALQGAQKALVIPISFVSEHVETLSEVNIEARQLAQQLGITQFEMMPALNDSPKFIRALAALVLREVACELPSQRKDTQRAP